MKLPRFAHLYCGFTPDLPYRHKIGWSLSAEKRWKDIKRELGKELGRDIDVWTLPVPILYARECEQFIFRVFKSLQYTGLKTSTGRTEYFWSVNIFTFLTLWDTLTFFGFQDGFYWALFTLLIPVPLDGFLMILIIFILQWAAIIGTFAGLIWYII